MTFKTIIAALGIGLATVAAPAPAFAKDAPVYTGTFNNTAVSGYDTVAYFTQGRPVKGSTEFKTNYNGAEWRFASAANLAKFRASPARYAPQYGGYCAWAVSQGYTASGDPTVWKVVNGKLYLNYNQEIGTKWSKNIPGFIRAGDANWPKVLG
jgi:YHS domain-containing protein